MKYSELTLDTLKGIKDALNSFPETQRESLLLDVFNLGSSAEAMDEVVEGFVLFRNNQFKTILHLACELKFHALREILLSIPSIHAQINTPNPWGYTPLYAAVLVDNFEAAQILIQLGASLDVKPLKDLSLNELLHKKGFQDSKQNFIYHNLPKPSRIIIDTNPRLASVLPPSIPARVKRTHNFFTDQTKKRCLSFNELAQKDEAAPSPHSLPHQSNKKL